MVFMKKEELQAEAQRLGIDISGMKYQEQVAAVSAALRGESASSQTPVADPRPTEEKQVSPEEMKVSPEEMKRRRNIEQGRKVYDEVMGKRIIIAPGIRAGEKPRVDNKYEEVLGNEMNVSEISYDLGSLGNPMGMNTTNNGTFMVTGISDKQVIGKASLPKEQAAISFTPGDWFPLITDPVSGKSGYPFKKYVKPYLIQAGVYEDYRDRFDGKKYPGNCFYICGWSCVDKGLVDWIFEDVNRRIKEEEERKKRAGY